MHNMTKSELMLECIKLAVASRRDDDDHEDILVMADDFYWQLEQAANGKAYLNELVQKEVHKEINRLRQLHEERKKASQTSTHQGSMEGEQNGN